MLSKITITTVWVKVNSFFFIDGLNINAYGLFQIHVNDPKYSWEKDYPFDRVFPSDSTNQEVLLNS
jgi:hypothetical protein